MLAPANVAEAAATLAELSRRRQPVRFVGGGTHVDRSLPGEAGERELRTSGLDELLEHNAADFTAVLGAGMPLARAQETFAASGQMLALDPPLGAGGLATIGGVLATADSGPCRHRYGAARDLVIGITVVLSDGSVAKAGGKVIKNVAGYDLGKLFAGSCGTLGLIAEVAVRLHPKPARTATVIASSERADALAAAAASLAASPLEAECLDVLWRQGRGSVLVRFAGSAALERARATAATLLLDDVAVEQDDAAVWERQRWLQRSEGGAAIKIAALPSDLPAVLASAARAEGTLVSRVALGLSWLTIAASENLGERVSLAEDGLSDLRHTRVELGAARGWQVDDPGSRRLMELVKRRFDPAGILPSGVATGAS
jgi:glycolate oxidase FAD binding subunit